MHRIRHSSLVEYILAHVINVRVRWLIYRRLRLAAMITFPVCALIQNGYGRNETPQSKANWLNLQRATSSMRLDQGSDPSPVISSPKLYTASPILSPGNGYSPSLTKSSPFTRAVSGAGLFGNSYMSPGKARLVQKNINNAAGSDNIGETLLKLIESEKVR